jgi:hypothetical protein
LSRDLRGTERDLARAELAGDHNDNAAFRRSLPKLEEAAPFASAIGCPANDDVDRLLE